MIFISGSLRYHPILIFHSLIEMLYHSASHCSHPVKRNLFVTCFQHMPSGFTKPYQNLYEASETKHLLSRSYNGAYQQCNRSQYSLLITKFNKWREIFFSWLGRFVLNLVCLILFISIEKRRKMG